MRAILVAHYHLAPACAPVIRILQRVGPLPPATYSIPEGRLNAAIVDFVMTGSEMGAPANS